MPTYVAFLRAINLGATRKFPKASIVEATETAGFAEVATHINTGNVRLATAMRSRARIEAALENAYLADRGFEVPTIVFTQAELREIADEAVDLSDGYDGSHYVSLLKMPPPAAAAKTLESRGTENDHAYVRGRAVHLLVKDPYHHARFTNADVEKALGVATNRNLTVIRALVEKWC